MAEYIERNALISDISETVIFSGKPGHTSAEMRGANKVIDRIREAPAADVVEVVRCGKCIFAKPMTKTEKELYSHECIVCLQLSPYGSRIVMSSDSYCSYGERKDGAE